MARLGGDEFVLLLAGLQDPAEAAQVAERVARNVAACRVAAHADVRATASIGVAVETAGSGVSELLETADHAMYEAKQRGKNQVAVAVP